MKLETLSMPVLNLPRGPAFLLRAPRHVVDDARHEPRAAVRNEVESYVLRGLREERAEERVRVGGEFRGDVLLVEYVV